MSEFHEHEAEVNHDLGQSSPGSHGHDDGDREEYANEPEVRTPLVVRLAAFMPVLFCILGTGRTAWEHGLAALMVGALVMLYPARGRVPYGLLVPCAAIAILTLLPLLPIPSLFPPAWRVSLEQNLSVPLAATWSAQPWITLENWVGLMVIMTWFLWVTAQTGLAEGRAEILRIVSMGISLVAIAALLFRSVNWEPASWEWEGRRAFGPFANRNHFSTLMAINAVLCLACAYDLQRRRKRSWILHALGLAPCFAVVLANGSRMGLALFFLGVLAWFASAALRKRSMKRLAIGGTVLLALTSGLVLFGQNVMSRFSKGDASVVETLSADGRLAVYENTLSMILNHPVLGVGLGNFAGVFGMTHEMTAAYSRFRHPESDVLWFVSEAGWPAGLAAMAAVILFVAWMGPWKVGKRRSSQRRERRLRLAAGLAVLLALAHGMVDVPGHELPLAVLLALLAGMAIHHHKVESSPGLEPSTILKAGGVLCLIGGVFWALTWLGLSSAMGESAWRRELAAAKRLSEQNEAGAAWPRIQRATRLAPLSWEAWYYRGAIGLQMGRSHSDALDDFGRCRYLEPHVAQICMAEADVWLRIEPMLAVPAWREALRREKTEDVSRYWRMLEAARQNPELRSQVRDLASNPRLMLAYLKSCDSGEEFREALGELLSRYPTLEGMTGPDRAELFHWWANRGDRKYLADMIDTHKDWLKDGWRFRAAEYAAVGKFKDAVELVLANVVTTINFTADASYNIEQLQKDFAFNPSDAARGFRLAMAQRDRKQWDAAVQTLEKISLQPTAPKHVYFELGKTLGMKEDYPKAWEQLNRYLQM